MKRILKCYRRYKFKKYTIILKSKNIAKIPLYPLNKQERHVWASQALQPLAAMKSGEGLVLQ